MKKTLLLPLFLILLSGCSEKGQFEQAVLKDMQKDQDIKDYKIDPQNMADCVVENIGKKMPGVFFGDPERWKAYLLYTKMIGLSESKNPEQTLKELQTEFGNGRGLSEAKNHYSQSVFECLGQVMMKFGEPESESGPEAEPEPEQPNNKPGP
jgi:hypothetical protein